VKLTVLLRQLTDVSATAFVATGPTASFCAAAAGVTAALTAAAAADNERRLMLVKVGLKVVSKQGQGGR
jgi:hypothetical protein